MRLLILFFLFLSIGESAAAAEYVLNSGDVIMINVWGYDELQLRDVEIRPDGKIAMPLAGELQAAGKTTGEMSQDIADKLGRYIKNPIVATNIMHYHMTRLYVLGEVARPGMYEIGRRHNVLDVLGSAGGYTKYAAKKRVFLIRNGKTKTEEMIQIDLMKLLEKGDMTQNYAMEDGDTLYLTSNGKISFLEDVLPWINAVNETKIAFWPASDRPTVTVPATN